MEKVVKIRKKAAELFKNVKAKNARHKEKEKDLEERLNKMGVELEAKSTFELELQDKVKALRIWRRKLIRELCLRRRQLKMRVAVLIEKSSVLMRPSKGLRKSTSFLQGS